MTAKKAAPKAKKAAKAPKKAASKKKASPKTKPKAKPKPKAKSTRKVGRPTKYTKILADNIMIRRAGGESMRSIARDPAMPAFSTIFKWLTDYPEFSDQYAQANAICAECWFEDILEIADDGRNDWMEIKDKEGACIGWRLNGEHVQRSKLRVDSRKWAVSKMLPKKYGDSLRVGGDGEEPIKVDHEHNFDADDVLATVNDILSRSE